MRLDRDSLRANARWIVWAAAAVLALSALELGRGPAADPLATQTQQASERMQAAARVIAAERTVRGLPIDPATDPNRTGLIGPEHTPITTTLGHLGAKRTSTNPNMAGLVVQLLGRAGATPGGCAAVALSGSFPALNIAVLAALDAMRLRPVAVSTVGASTYGATDPDFTWPDMETVLVERRVLAHRSAAVAPGGVDRDSPLFGDEGWGQVRAAMERSGLEILEENGDSGLAADVEHRMRLYDGGCNGLPDVFVNVGGGLTALGRCRAAERLPPGLLPSGIRGGEDCGVLFRMAESGVPVIHLLNVLGLAREHRLPVDPVPLPGVQPGRVGSESSTMRVIAAAGLLIVLSFGWWAGRRRSPNDLAPPADRK
jgi:poly-gamma-glutamate system protein